MLTERTSPSSGRVHAHALISAAATRSRCFQHAQPPGRRRAEALSFCLCGIQIDRCARARIRRYMLNIPPRVLEVKPSTAVAYVESVMAECCSLYSQTAPSYLFDSRASESFVSIIPQSVKPRVTAITRRRVRNTDHDPEPTSSSKQRERV